MSSRKPSELLNPFLVYRDPGSTSSSDRYGYSAVEFYHKCREKFVDSIDIIKFDLTEEEAKDLCGLLNIPKRKRDPLNFSDSNQVSKSLIPKTAYVLIPHKKINNIQIPITHHQNPL
ncbi:hypothetical protein CMI38_03380 [Candidatus Pacearchaeota archaeon]|jgi:hypothetical protein|nr:hypothetical protein [Candidatus Pacearchaeota archaeon]|tara:strand:- start:231 stop:581 length:351 start_codon:yes stop_codon:yes gene_type:complete